jgi:hypothetical protein
VAGFVRQPPWKAQAAVSGRSNSRVAAYNAWLSASFLLDSPRMTCRRSAGTLHPPACGVSNASSPFSWFSPGPRTRNLRPPVDEHPHDPPRRRPIDNPLMVGGTTLGRWLREGRRVRIELLDARWHNPAGRHRPGSCPAWGVYRHQRSDRVQGGSAVSPSVFRARPLVSRYTR